MNEQIFNSPFELSLRVLLTLSVIPYKALTVDEIAIYDFITTYAKEFSLADNNLHGDSEFSFSEFAFRRERICMALKDLVLDRLVYVNKTKLGFLYCISSSGKSYIDTCSTQYAREYRAQTKKTAIFAVEQPLSELVELIGRTAASNLRRR